MPLRAAASIVLAVGFGAAAGRLMPVGKPTAVPEGIAEALIATAIGLFAAIPAVVAYNRFSTLLDRLAGRYELFVDEFVVLLQHQAHK